MRVISNPVCVDDYGTEWYVVEGVLIPVDCASVWKTYVPGVRGFMLRPGMYTRENYAAEIAAFHELDANCNTCAYLRRVKFDRTTKTVSMPGICGRTHDAIAFHPDDFMGMHCWEARAN